MPISNKTVFIREDGTFLALSQKKADDLFNGKPEASIPEFAGKTVRHALFFYETEHRRPVRIVRAEYNRYRFDDRGLIDMHVHCLNALNHISLFDTMPFFNGQPKPKSDTIIPAEKKFARRRYEHEWKWTPSEAMENDLLKLIFRKGNLWTR